MAEWGVENFIIFTIHECSEGECLSKKEMEEIAKNRPELTIEGSDNTTELYTL